MMPSMWWTPEGERILVGAEAALFGAALAGLVTDIEEETDAADQTILGVKVFDRLSRPERLAILEHVAEALVTVTVSCPALTAVAEGAIAAVYYPLVGEIEVEIDEKRRDLRGLVRAACGEAGQDELPAVASNDRDEWELRVESFMDLILRDADWETEFLPLDAPPEVAGGLREAMGIDSDDYTAVAPDPSPPQLKRVRASLWRLINKAKK